MADLADKYKDEGNHIVCDFVCPTPEARKLFNADFVIWVDTIKKGRFDDTNAMFVKPEKFDFHVTTQDAKVWAKNNRENKVMSYEWDNKKPTAQMLEDGNLFMTDTTLCLKRLLKKLVKLASKLEMFKE